MEPDRKLGVNLVVGTSRERTGQGPWSTSDHGLAEEENEPLIGRASASGAGSQDPLGAQGLTRVKDDVLLYKWQSPPERHLYVVPTHQRLQMMMLAHDNVTAGHLGIEKKQGKIETSVLLDLAVI
jgi:hypothetical protein